MSADHAATARARTRRLDASVRAVRSATRRAGWRVVDELRVTTPETARETDPGVTRARLELRRSEGALGARTGGRLLVVTPAWPEGPVEVAEGRAFLLRVEGFRWWTPLVLGPLVSRLRKYREEPYVSNASYRHLVEATSSVTVPESVQTRYSVQRLVDLAEVTPDHFEDPVVDLDSVLADLAAGVPLEWALRRVTSGRAS